MIRRFGIFSSTFDSILEASVCAIPGVGQAPLNSSGAQSAYGKTSLILCLPALCVTCGTDLKLKLP